MSLTPLSFFATMEARLRPLLPAEPAPGGEWQYQRLLSFHDRTGSLQILAGMGSPELRLLAVLQIRQISDERGAFLRGSLKTAINAQPAQFVLHDSKKTSQERDLEDLSQRCAREILQALEAERGSLSGSAPQQVRDQAPGLV